MTNQLLEHEVENLEWQEQYGFGWEEIRGPSNMKPSDPEVENLEWQKQYGFGWEEIRG